MNEQGRLSAQAFCDEIASALLLLARLLNSVGWTSRDVESRLRGTASFYGCTLDVAAGPTTLMLEVQSGTQSRTRIARLHPGGLDLGRLSEERVPCAEARGQHPATDDDDEIIESTHGWRQSEVAGSESQAGRVVADTARSRR